jgi:hypothetical protein
MLMGLHENVRYYGKAKLPVFKKLSTTPRILWESGWIDQYFLDLGTSLR